MKEYHTETLSKSSNCAWLRETAMRRGLCATVCVANCRATSYLGDPVAWVDMCSLAEYWQGWQALSNHIRCSLIHIHVTRAASCKSSPWAICSAYRSCDLDAAILPGFVIHDCSDAMCHFNDPQNELQKSPFIICTHRIGISMDIGVILFIINRN